MVARRLFYSHFPAADEAGDLVNAASGLYRDPWSRIGENSSERTARGHLELF